MNWFCLSLLDDDDDVVLACCWGNLCCYITFWLWVLGVIFSSTVCRRSRISAIIGSSPSHLHHYFWHCLIHSQLEAVTIDILFYTLALIHLSVCDPHFVPDFHMWQTHRFSDLHILFHFILTTRIADRHWIRQGSHGQSTSGSVVQQLFCLSCRSERQNQRRLVLVRHSFLRLCTVDTSCSHLYYHPGDKNNHDVESFIIRTKCRAAGSPANHGEYS